MVLLKVLMEFAPTPQLFFDWNFDTYWFNEQLPDEILPVIKVQIRVFQINFCLATEMDTIFLANDLQGILAKVNTGPLEQAMSGMVFSRLKMQSQPLDAMQHLADSNQAFDELAKISGDGELSFEQTDLLNSIWLVFVELHTKEEYQRWFDIYAQLNVSSGIIDPETNDLYVMAATSIYRNAVVKNKDAGIDIPEMLQWICEVSKKHGLDLMAVYALKSCIQFYSEDGRNFQDSVPFINKEQELLKANPIYYFLVYGDLAAKYFYNGNIETAYYYIDQLKSIKLPEIYVEQLDFLLVYFQVAFRKGLDNVNSITNEALALTLDSHRYHLDDKVKLYGETAIAATNENKFIDALHLYEKGYELLLDKFINTEEQQAIVIRYGNALKYLSELIEYGQTKSFGTGGNVVPEPGYFYRTNEKLLEGGYYFEERKFMVSSILQGSFEDFGDFEKSKKWAYKSIELAQQLEKAQFIPILQGKLHYLITDRQYRQAYNLQAYIDKFYKDVKEKDEVGEKQDQELVTKLRKLREDDLAIYFFILLPIAVCFSSDIFEEKVTAAQYQQMIDDAFNHDQYILHDAEAFRQAKGLFEQIIIHQISYQKMMELINAINVQYKDFIYVVCCILLSTFSTAKDGFHLQLIAAIEIDKFKGKSNAILNLFYVPYFLRFWERKLETHAAEFSGKEHLKKKGFELIARAPQEKRLPSIFYVYADHLDVHPSTAQRNFIDSI